MGLAERLVELGQVCGTPAVPLSVSVGERALAGLNFHGTGVIVAFGIRIGTVVAVCGSKGEPVGHVPDELEVCGKVLTVALFVVVLLVVQNVVGVLGIPLLAVVGADIGVHLQEFRRIVAIIVHFIRNVEGHHGIGGLAGTPFLRRSVVLSVIGTDIQRETVCNWSGKVSAGGSALVARVYHGSLLIVVVQAHVIVHPSGLSGNGCVVILYHSGVEDCIYPVEVLDTQHVFGWSVTSDGAFVQGFAEVVHLIGIHGLEASGKGLLHAHAGLEIDRGLILFGALCGNHNDTARCRGAVKGRCRSIFKDREGFNVVGVETASCNAIHDIQGACAGGDGTCTAYADIGTGTGLSSGVHYHYTGNLALEHIANIRGGYIGQFVTVHGYHSAGEFGLFLGSETKHHHFLQKLCILA